MHDDLTKPYIATAATLDVITAFSLDLFAQPASQADECQARIFGLRGADSLKPWRLEGVNNVENLARRDYEPEFGSDWREEWARRLDEVFVVLEGRFGRDWPDILTDMVTERQCAMSH